MKIERGVSLKDYSTMRLGGSAAFLVKVTNVDELVNAFAWATERKLPAMVIGGGSNIVWRDEGYDGLIIVNQIKKFKTQKNGDSTLITAGAGEDWDSVVERCVRKGLSGIEGLSLIPGTAGATPVQNVGAYGQEIAQTLVHVEAYDTKTQKLVSIPNGDCQFAYRKSRFNGADRGRFAITAITLRLEHKNPQPPFYLTVDKYLKDHKITGTITPKIMRQAVVAIRQSKLPDPKKVANNGSFFGNPIVAKQVFMKLKAKYGQVPHRHLDDGRVKLSAAWMIEKIGLKGYSDEATGMATWHLQPLVFVNEHAKNTEQLIAFRQKIMGAVKSEFGVTLAQEPELLP